MSELTQKEKKEIDDSMKETENTAQVKEDALANVEVNKLSVPGSGFGIQGLEEADPATIPLPFVRLVQPSSKNVLLADGNEAPAGSYLFDDTSSAFEELEIVILKGKHGQKTFIDKKTGDETTKKVLAILGVLPDTEKVFLLQLSVMSYAPFGKYMAQLKEKKAEATFQYKVKLNSRYQENDYGKFYVANIEIGEELPEDQYVRMAELFEQYQSVVNKAFDEKPQKIEAEPADNAEEGEIVEDNGKINGTNIPVAEDIPF